MVKSRIIREHMGRDLQQIGVFLISEPVPEATAEEEKQRRVALKVAAEAVFSAGGDVVMCENMTDIEIVMAVSETVGGAVYAVAGSKSVGKKEEETLTFHTRHGNLFRLGRVAVNELLRKQNIKSVVIIGGDTKARSQEEVLRKADEKLDWVAFESTGGRASELAKTPGVTMADREYRGPLIALAGFRLVEAVLHANERIAEELVVGRGEHEAIAKQGKTRAL